MSNIESLTPNFAFKIPEFNTATWHDEIKYNFQAIDALLSNFVASMGYKGSWQKVTEYFVGDSVFIADEDSDNYGKLYLVKEHHITTADPFDTFLGQHPTYYVLQGIQAAYEAAQLAQDWATKEDGKVVYNEQEIDYSSKAYAIGADGTETNNSKYYCQQSQAAANDPNVVAIGTDLLDAQSHIKNVSNNMNNVQNLVDNMTKIVNVSDISADVTTVSQHIPAIEACAADIPNLDQKANKNNAELTGVPTAPTAATSTDSQQIATTGFVKQLWQEVEEVPQEYDPNVFYYILET